MASGPSGLSVEQVMAAMLAERKIQLHGDITMEDVRNLEAVFVYLKRSKRPVTISLCTGGGNAYAAFGLYDLIRDYQRYFPVDIVAVGICMSAGTIIMQAARKRLSLPNTSFMVHGIQSPFLNMAGKPSDTVTAETLRLQGRLEHLFAERTRIDVKRLKGNIYCGAPEAIKAGLIDAVVEPR